MLTFSFESSSPCTKINSRTRLYDAAASPASRPRSAGSLAIILCLTEGTLFSLTEVLFYFRWSITPIMYPGAFFFSEASSAYVFMIVVNLFVGVTATVTTFILQLFPDDVVCKLTKKCCILARNVLY